MAMRAKSGSVLMEFVIVLPIYMILLGMAFFYGELSLHGINLAASADRTAAVARGGEEWGGWNGYTASAAEADFGKAISPSRELVEESLAYREEGTSARPSSYLRRHAGHVANVSFRGSWSWLVAATVEDNYAMTPWTRGMVGTWAHLEWLVDMTTPPDAVSSDSVLGTLFGGGLGRATMTGKDGVGIGSSGGVAVYSYYTLTRNSKGRIDKQSYRHWDFGALVDGVAANATWNKYVYGEGWQLAEEYASMGNGKGADPPSYPGDRPFYKRYEQFYKTWSN